MSIFTTDNINCKKVKVDLNGINILDSSDGDVLVIKNGLVQNLASNVDNYVLTSNPSSTLGVEWQPKSDGGASIFSVNINSIAINNTTGQLNTWSASIPSYNSGDFNTISGDFTVPSTGKYKFTIIINYSTGTLTSQLGISVNPGFVLRRTVPSTFDLISSPLPLINVNIALLLTLRIILASAQIVLVGDLELSIGDVIGLIYDADGFIPTLTLGSNFTPGVIWSVSKLS